MARLTVSEILKKIEAPKNGASLSKAVYHERKIQIHTEPVDVVSDYNEGHYKFLEWVKTIVANKGKYDRFLQFLKFPYFTNDITDSIFTQLSGIFESRNSFRKYDFENPENEQDFLKYLSDISDSFFWKSDVWDSIKNNINSVIVIDMPSGESTRPDPYSYIVKTPDIIDIDNSVVRSTTVDKKLFKSYKVEYLIFRDNGRIIALDDEFYRVFSEVNGNISVISESPHTLGYCPATQIYSDTFNGVDTIRKKGPISTTISDLDFVLFIETFQRFAESYVPNPITVKYAEQCNYVADNGIECDQGRLMVPDVYNEGEYSYRACPKCNTDSMVGPGEMLEVQPPSTKEEFDQIDAIHFVQPPLDGLNFTSINAQNRTDDIINKTVGVSDDFNQAQNEKQVLSRYESKQKIFRKIATNIEIAQKFTHTTIAKLRYNNDFKGCSIFLGDEFFLETEKELQLKYKEEKDNGNSEFELSLSRDKISETKHKDNPNLLQKTKFLSFIEPYQGQTLAEVQTLKKDFQTLVNDVDFVIKINFDRFVKRYETEEQPISMLLNQDIFIDKKIEVLKSKFVEYANELIVLPIIEGNTITDDVTGEERPDVEAEAKARLKGSVGGVQGILEIQKSVVDGTTSKEAALVILEEIFGFPKEIGLKMLQGKLNINQNQNV